MWFSTKTPKERWVSLPETPSQAFGRSPAIRYTIKNDSSSLWDAFIASRSAEEAKAAGIKYLEAGGVVSGVFY